MHHSAFQVSRTNQVPTTRPIAKRISDHTLPDTRHQPISPLLWHLSSKDLNARLQESVNFDYDAMTVLPIATTSVPSTRAKAFLYLQGLSSNFGFWSSSISPCSNTTGLPENACQIKMGRFDITLLVNPATPGNHEPENKLPQINPVRKGEEDGCGGIQRLCLGAMDGSDYTSSLPIYHLYSAQRMPGSWVLSV